MTNKRVLNKKILSSVILFMFCIIWMHSLSAATKSTGKAMLLSAVLPGAGQMYLGRTTRAGIFLGAETTIILSYLRLNNEVEWKKNTYMLHAERYADVPVNSPDSRYRFIADYVSSDNYNAEVIRYFRNLYLIHNYDPDLYRESLDRYLVPDDEAWHWENRESWLRYREIRREKQEFEIFTNFALGALVLNRLVSVIDTAIIGRSINRSPADSEDSYSTILSDLYFKPDYLRNGISLHYNYRF